MVRKTIQLVLAVLFFAQLFPACGKNKDCWEAWDRTLALNGVVVCDKTYDEARAAYPQYYFSRRGETRECWRINPINRALFNMPRTVVEAAATEAGYTISKLTCGNSCQIGWIEQKQSKITGLYGPEHFFYEVFETQDTCNRLTINRVIVVGETADSITIRRVGNKEP